MLQGCDQASEQEFQAGGLRQGTRPPHVQRDRNRVRHIAVRRIAAELSSKHPPPTRARPTTRGYASIAGAVQRVQPSVLTAPFTSVGPVKPKLKRSSRTRRSEQGRRHRRRCVARTNRLNTETASFPKDVT